MAQGRFPVNEQHANAGTLGWGVKQSFRDYLSRQADFSLNLDDGATVGAGNTVQFPVVEDDPTEGVVCSARGRAVFRAHGGMMRLTLKDPRVVRTGSGLELAFDIGSVAEGSAARHVPVARLEERPGTDPATQTYRTFLLADATGLFNDIYPAESELDEVVVTWGARS
jgi:hypothetical protein